MADVETVKQESRVFFPSAEFAKQATVSGMEAHQALCAEAEQDYEAFWAKLARENLIWQKPFALTLDESNAPFYQWFADGHLNVSCNCLDSNLQNGNSKISSVAKSRAVFLRGNEQTSLLEAFAKLADPADPRGRECAHKS